MSNEREMLEFAAKACGIDGVWQEGFGMCLIGEYLKNPGETPRFWNPKDNSADCAAMCAKLRIETLWSDLLDFVECSHDDVFYQAFNKDHNKDDEAAWRYAATMVAAKIGEMK